MPRFFYEKMKNVANIEGLQVGAFLTVKVLYCIIFSYVYAKFSVRRFRTELCIIYTN